MKKISTHILTLLVMLLALPASVLAEVYNLTPTQTTKIQGAADDGSLTGDECYYDGNATTWLASQSAVSGSAFKNNNSKYGGSYIAITKFDAAATLTGKNLTKATLKFHSKCTVSGKNSRVDVALIGTGWDAITATWNNTNTAEIMNAQVILGDGGSVNTSGKDIEVDVTEYLTADEDKALGFAIYTYTAREQEISNLELVVEAIDASASSQYTVKYVDESGNEIKTAEVRNESIGAIVVLNDEDKLPVYNEDKTKKYIYVSDDTESNPVAAGGATVVTVTFREAAIWNYTVNAVDSEGALLKELKRGTNFEAENFGLGFAAYTEIDGVLYKSEKSSSSDGKGFTKKITLDQDNYALNIPFAATETTGIVYLSEAEDIPGLTLTTNGNTGIRSSNAASAYAADADVEFVKLAPGKYKLTAAICDASKNAGSNWKFIAGGATPEENDTIFDYTATAINYVEGTSEEFEITKETPILLAKGGSAMLGVDLIYIQKTGDVEVAATPAQGEMNFNAMTDLPVSSNDATDGDITTDKVMTADEFSVTISPKVSGSTPNRFWSTADGPQLRIYNGTLTVSAAAGKVINKIEFVIADSKWGTVTADKGTLEGQLWTGEAETVVFTITSQCRINSIIVGEKQAPAIPAAANIAELKAMETGTAAVLTLTDAKLTVHEEFMWQPMVIIEDATGAIQIPEGMLTAMPEQFAKAGVALNGTLYGTFLNEWGTTTFDANESTANSEVTVADAVIEPTVKAVADVKTPEWAFRFVKFENVEFIYDEVEYEYIIKQGEETIKMQDIFRNMEYDENSSLVVYNKLKYITGIIYDDGMGGYSFVPVGAPAFEAAPAIPTATSIAELKAMETGTAAVLTLTDAKVTVCDQFRWSKLVVIEDATGAIQIPDGMQAALPETFAKAGVALNGTLYGTFFNEWGTMTFDANESTANSEVTAADAVVEPTVKTIAEVKNPEWSFRFVKFENVEFIYNETEYEYIIKQGEETIQMQDMLKKMEYDENSSLVVYNKLKYITGIIYDDGMGGYSFVPVGAPAFEAEKEPVYKAFTENTVFLPTVEAVAAAVEEGWVIGGETRVDNKKGNIDPATGAACDATTFPGVGLKKNNDSKKFIVYVSGVEKVVAYGTTTSSSAERALIVTATPAEGEAVTANATSLPNETAVVTVELDKTKNYIIEFTGTAADDLTAGGDVALHGVKFVVDSVLDGISNVNSGNAPNDNIYNLNGTMVRKAGESLNGLSKGIYVIGGKKVVIK